MWVRSEYIRPDDVATTRTAKRGFANKRSNSPELARFRYCLIFSLQMESLSVPRSTSRNIGRMKESLLISKYASGISGMTFETGFESTRKELTAGSLECRLIVAAQYTSFMQS